MTTLSTSLQTITQILTYYGYSFMLIFGNIGNFLNIALFLQKKLRTTSCNNYLLASAFTNLIALNVSIICIIFSRAESWNLTVTYCKIQVYVMNISLQMSRYLILVACFDRYALCSTNAYLRKFCNVHLARQCIIPCIFLICLIIPLHVPIYVTVINNDCEFIGVGAIYNCIYGIIMIGIIPPGLMLLFSLLTFRNLKLRQRRRQIRPFIVGKKSSSMHDNLRTQVKDEQVLAMLLIQVLAYTVSSTPYTIARLYLVLKGNIDDNELDGNVSNTLFILFITDMLRFFCPFMSFYLFILVSQLYRNEMKLLILRIYHWCNPLRNRDNIHHNNMTLTQNPNSARHNQFGQQQNQSIIPTNVIAN